MLCQPNPCRNSGRCEQLNADTFQCHCVDPFEGDRCQLGGCKTRPCLNWGQCSDLFEPNELGLGMLPVVPARYSFLYFPVKITWIQITNACAPWTIMARTVKYTLAKALVWQEHLLQFSQYFSQHFSQLFLQSVSSESAISLHRFLFRQKLVFKTSLRLTQKWIFKEIVHFCGEEMLCCQIHSTLKMICSKMQDGKKQLEITWLIMTGWWHKKHGMVIQMRSFIGMIEDAERELKL